MGDPRTRPPGAPGGPGWLVDLVALAVMIDLWVVEWGKLYIGKTKKKTFRASEKMLENSMLSL